MSPGRIYDILYIIIDSIIYRLYWICMEYNRTVRFPAYSVQCRLITFLWVQSRTIIISFSWFTNFINQSMWLFVDDISFASRHQINTWWLPYVQLHWGLCFDWLVKWEISRMKYILIHGGVISGVGKGIISSSIGTLMKSLGLRVTAIKIDPYLNIDAGTFNPYEHGEVRKHSSARIVFSK